MRRAFLLSLFVIGLGGLFARSVYLQLFEHEFLEEEGKARHLRVVEIPAHRGMILDRNGELLAVSTPIHSVWANPLEALQSHKAIRNVALILNMNADHLIKKLQSKKNRQFFYVKRHIAPEQAEKLKLDMYKGNAERNRKIIDRLLEILNEVILEDVPKDNHTSKLFR